MKTYLYLGDLELLRDIANNKINDASSLNDPQRRSARYLYNQELISNYYLKDLLEITSLGKERLAQGQ